MRVMIAGIDGYLGWSLALYLAAREHEVAGIDNFSRRSRVAADGSQSAIPILPMVDRRRLYAQYFGRQLPFFDFDLQDYSLTRDSYNRFKPDAIVYLGEQPSAPWSMADVHQAVKTQRGNVLGTLTTLWAMKEVCPAAHLIKLGTMGEYGTPADCPIPEGVFPAGSEWHDVADGHVANIGGLMFPRDPGSYYHLSKLHDTYNIRFACKVHGLCSTDIMQGVVYGTRIPEMSDDFGLATRFDFDEIWGTCLNRFCAQAVIGEPITPYGRGGQTRGYLPLQDSMQCLLLTIENPPQPGEYRTFNQLEETYTVNELAEIVCDVAAKMNLNPSIQSIENPRVEAEEHFYEPTHQHLLDLGYQPTGDIRNEVRNMLTDLLSHRDRIAVYRDRLQPVIRWRG